MSPRALFWVRILANLLGAIGALAAVVNPPSVFNGEQPIGFLFLGASVFLFILTVHAPLTGFARVFDLGGWAAVLIVIAFLLTKDPAIHDWLLVRSHEGKGPRFGWAQDSDDLDPRYGPKLVRSDAAMARRYELLHEYPSAHWVVEKCEDYAFLYASLRLRGRSDEQIFSDPIGPALFLGTLVAETYPPDWWETTAWLKQSLNPHPTADWKMGLLPPAWARAKFQTLVVHPPASDTSVLEGLLIVARERADFATPQQFDGLLETWNDVRKKDGNPLDATLGAGRAVAEALQAHVQNDRVGVRFVYPPTWSSKACAVYSRQLMLFLRASGLHPELRDNGVPIAISAQFLAWNNVAYTMQEQVWKEVEVQHEGGHIAGTHSFSTPYTTHRNDLEMVHSDGRGQIGVPTLVVRVSEKQFMLPPVTVINRNSANHLSDCDPSRDPYKDTYEEFLADMTLAPWRFALSWSDSWPKRGDDALAQLAEWKPR
jgi:hypothetical protein